MLNGSRSQKVAAVGTSKFHLIKIDLNSLLKSFGYSWVHFTIIFHFIFPHNIAIYIPIFFCASFGSCDNYFQFTHAMSHEASKSTYYQQKFWIYSHYAHFEL